MKHSSIIAWQVAILNAVGLLAACGGASEATTNSQDGSGGSTTKPEDPEKPEVTRDSTGGSTTKPENPPVDAGVKPPPEPPQVGSCAPVMPRPGSERRPAPEELPAYACLKDEDCTAQGQGWCAPAFNEELEVYGAECVYATCRENSDCLENQVCKCEGLGTCIPGNCTSDDDCAGDSRCIYTSYSNSCRTFEHYWCSTPQDECTSDADCEGTTCTFEGGRHVCLALPDDCSIGRPFLVEGQARTAAVCAGNRWRQAAAVVGTAGLSDSLRATISDYFVRVGLMEHASIAAFARFSLQLLSLGAPPELIDASAQAMRDETRHAKLAFELASRFGGKQCDPGRLDLDCALNETELRDVAVATVLEGCIGETVAAMEAEWASEAAQDPELRRVLTIIGQDERRHAELAWRFVAWALAQDQSLSKVLLRVVEGEFEAARERARTQNNNGPSLLEFGVVSDSERAKLREQALEAVILPCLRTLCGVSVPWAA